MTGLIEVVGVNQANCVNCHACIAACPVKLCNDGSGPTVQINSDLCIACGRCINACTHDARFYIDDFVPFLSAVQSGERIVAMVAPSVSANFPDQYLKLNGWLKTLGVEAIFDVSFGAELTARSYVEHIKTHQPKMVIAQPCPAVVTYIELYQPELLPYVAPVHSPMLHTVQMIRHKYPQYADCKIAAISPCTAKKREFQATGLGNYNIGMVTIDAFLQDNNIKLGDYPSLNYDNPPAERAVMFSTPGGLMETVGRSLPGIQRRTRKIEGPTRVYRYLEQLPQMIKAGRAPQLLDCLNCDNGCNAGPLTISQHQPIDEVEHWVAKRMDQMQEYYAASVPNGATAGMERLEEAIDRYWDPKLFGREYLNRWQNRKLTYPTLRQVQAIFAQMHKTDEKQQQNCSSCGYGTCKDMAVAIFNGLNRPENCHFYLVEEAERAHDKTIKVRNELESILETSLDGFVQVDRDNFIVRVNPAMKRLLKREDLVGLKLLDFLDDVNKAIMRNEHRERSFGRGTSYELKMTQSDGGSCFVLISATPILDQQGQWNGAYAMVSDISKLKHAEALLRRTNEGLEQTVRRRTAQLSESLEELRSVNETLEKYNVELEKLSIVARETDNAIVIIDPQGGLEWANEGFERFYGFTLDVFKQRYGDTIFETSTNHNIRELIKVCIQTNQSVSYQAMAPGQKNSKRWAQTTITPVYEKEGVLSKLVAIDTDITELKEAEDAIMHQKEEILQQKEEILAQTEAVMESEQMLLDIVEFLPDATFVINKEKIVIAWNRAMEVLTGVPKAQMIGRGEHSYAKPFYKREQPILIDMVFAEDQELEARYQNVIRKGDVVLSEVFIEDLDGGTFLSVTAAILRNPDGQPQGAIEVVRNITKRKLADGQLKAAHARLSDKNKLVMDQQRKITDSIRYAGRIQKAMLPQDGQLEAVLPQSFVFHSPRDLVSGDFFWVKQMNEHTLVAAADCTGHGVPGAFVSLLGMAFLDQISSLFRNGDLHPSLILDRLRKKVKRALNQTDHEDANSDGMDIALCMLNNRSLQMEFSGANNSLYLLRNGEMLVYKANRNPIGIHPKEVPFTNHRIQLQKGDVFYVFTDGYADQFGSGKRGKFMQGRFRKLLLQLHQLPMHQQKQQLSTHMKEWRTDEEGNLREQMDDMLIIGVRV